MYFFIDGYNLLFTALESKLPLQKQRNHFVVWMQSEFTNGKLQGTIVFDGAHRREEESGLSYPSPLIVAYTPKGQSADEYIVEQLEATQNCKIITVVTNDAGLKRHARAAGAKTQSNSDFLEWLIKRAKKKRPKNRPFRETDHQISRLAQIFEERFKKGSVDDLEGWE